jgi:hypothetical protein
MSGALSYPKITVTLEGAAASSWFNHALIDPPSIL